MSLLPPSYPWLKLWMSLSQLRHHRRQQPETVAQEIRPKLIDRRPNYWKYAMGAQTAHLDRGSHTCRPRHLRPRRSSTRPGNRGTGPLRSKPEDGDDREFAGRVPRLLRGELDLSPEGGLEVRRDLVSRLGVVCAQTGRPDRLPLLTCCDSSGSAAAVGGRMPRSRTRWRRFERERLPPPLCPSGIGRPSVEYNTIGIRAFFFSWPCRWSARPAAPTGTQYYRNRWRG